MILTVQADTASAAVTACRGLCSMAGVEYVDTIRIDPVTRPDRDVFGEYRRHVGFRVTFSIDPGGLENASHVADVADGRATA